MSSSRCRRFQHCLRNVSGWDVSRRCGQAAHFKVWSFVFLLPPGAVAADERLHDGRKWQRPKVSAGSHYRDPKWLLFPCCWCNRCIRHTVVHTVRTQSIADDVWLPYLGLKCAAYEHRVYSSSCPGSAHQEHFPFPESLLVSWDDNLG